MMSEGMSPADIAAVTGNGGGMGNWGADGWWILLLLLFAGGRGFGWGGNGGGCGSSCATQADLAAGFNNSAVLASLNDIKLGQANAINYNNQGFSGLNTTVMNGFHGVDNALCTLGYNMKDCCCETQRMIERLGCDIKDNANSNTRAILDFLTTQKIESLRDENQSLKLAASQANQNAFFTANQEAQTAELIRRLGRDCPVPAYVVPNPNCCYGNPVGVNYGGCGCG